MLGAVGIAFAFVPRVALAGPRAELQVPRDEVPDVVVQLAVRRVVEDRDAVLAGPVLGERQREGGGGRARCQRKVVDCGLREDVQVDVVEVGAVAC